MTVMNPENLKNFRNLLSSAGEDPNREGLEQTPKRFLKAFDFLTSGYHTDLETAMNDAVYTVDYQDMVVVRDVEFYSLCEHHVLPFYGRCHVGYIPNGKVIGLSKIPRLIEIFSRRLQVQERLTHEIGKALEGYLNADGVGVIMEAYHMCMMMRGVEKQSSYTVTSSMLGSFQNSQTRMEFMSHARDR
jgi:GTP cyclohydrolase IA